MGKQKKEVRKGYRFTAQISELLDEWTERLGKTETDLISTIIFLYLTDPRNFITCPEAGPDAWIKEEVPATEGISEFECENGNKFWYDWEQDKVIKVLKK